MSLITPKELLDAWHVYVCGKQYLPPTELAACELDELYALAMLSDDAEGGGLVLGTFPGAPRLVMDKAALRGWRDNWTTARIRVEQRFKGKGWTRSFDAIGIEAVLEDLKRLTVLNADPPRGIGVPGMGLVKAITPTTTRARFAAHVIGELTSILELPGLTATTRERLEALVALAKEVK